MKLKEKEGTNLTDRKHCSCLKINPLTGSMLFVEKESHVINIALYMFYLRGLEGGMEGLLCMCKVSPCTQ
jgi:hypothetical protein